MAGAALERMGSAARRHVPSGSGAQQRIPSGPRPQEAERQVPAGARGSKAARNQNDERRRNDLHPNVGLRVDCTCIMNNINHNGISECQLLQETAQ